MKKKSLDSDMKGKEEEMAMLQAKKERRFLRFQRYYDLIGNLDDPHTREQFRNYRVSLDREVAEFESLLDKINRLNLQLKENYSVDYQALDAVEDMVCAIRQADQELQIQPNPNEDSVPLEHLQHIKLPEFAGESVRWPTFRDAFVSLIHKNSKLAPISKLYYLLGALKGPALEVASQLQPSTDNYEPIWNTLVRKYDDPRFLADGHFYRMLDFRPLTSESAEGLTRLSEIFLSSYEALRKIPKLDFADYFVASLALSKLDPATRSAFESSILSRIPTLTLVMEFIKNHAGAISRSKRAVAPKKAVSTGCNSYGNVKPKSVPQTFVAKEPMSVSKSSPLCSLCRGPHLIYRCNPFVKASVEDRWNLVKKHKLCFNCLSDIHLLTACKSQSSCRLCKSKHHSMLHREVEEVPTTPVRSPPEPPVQNLLVHGASSGPLKSIVVLPTVLVRVVTPKGEFLLRFLTDSGSQVHLISLRSCRKLGLHIAKGPPGLEGIGGVSEPVRGSVNFVFSARADNNIQFEVEALVVQRITSAMPPCKLAPSHREQLVHLPLADPTFDAPGRIDGILGADLLTQILDKSPPVQLTGGPTAIATCLGYIVMGKASVVPSPLLSPRVLCTFDMFALDQVFRDFLELEDVGSPNAVALDECEKQFVRTTVRNDEGRFIVELPFAEFPPCLGDSYAIAKKRLLSLENHLRRSPNLFEKYREGINDYLSQGHVSPAPYANIHEGYFLPHFAVFKASSTTPVRIVFDASCKTTNGKSLNDVLQTGPKLQNDLQAILLRFRRHPAAVVADIRQMFRNVLVNPAHRPFIKFLWRSDPSESVKTFVMNCVPFGLNCAPFLALRCVKKLAEDERMRFPIASRIASLDMYVDDIVSSVPEGEVSDVVPQLVGLFRAGGFSLAKWSTNSAKIAECLSEEEREEGMRKLGEEALAGVKVLGLHWDSRVDRFFFAYRVREGSGTKRQILSTLARIWDPLGFLAPVTLLCKSLLKRLWQAKCGWDEQPPLEISRVWTQVSLELELLSKFSIPRYPGDTNDSDTLLVGFADSSEVGFGAVIYAITNRSSDNAAVTLLIAKSKIAPAKPLSIPRLELCAALLLSKLFRLVLASFSQFSHSQIFALSDSEDVLHWISKPPHQWKTFVANRVGKIQDLLPSQCWYHVPGTENIADLISRGATPSQLIEHPKWIRGPPWLTRSTGEWPVRKLVVGVREPLEAKPVVALATGVVEENSLLSLIDRVSSWSKLRRVVVHLLRFGKRLPKNHIVSASDLEVAELCLVRLIQREHFAEDLDLLSRREHPTAALRFLKPFLHEGCIRVGGRLEHAPISYGKKYPLLLPKKCRLVDLIIDHFHVFYLHAGPSLMLSLLRQKFWILSARNIVRKRFHSCNRCFRLNPKGVPPTMGALPSARVSEAKPFVSTGIDYAGPFRVTMGRYRGVRSQKAYVALFICMSTKAVHLELASNLSTESFLDCFKRFLARRGPVSTIYSDGGTNFVGAKNILETHQTMIRKGEFRDALGNLLATHNVTWKFNPPAAPHFGGLWESNVKSMKAHLFRVIGTQILAWEEFYTLLTQIEAVLNSRPLCALSPDPAEPEALTPAHFLTLAPLNSLPLLEPEDKPISVRKHLLDRMVKEFWKRWRLEYLSGLQPRKRWTGTPDSITLGTVVVVREDNAPPLHWPLGVIEEVHPGADGVVRVASVRMKKSIFKRPVVRLFPLPTQ